tara:strand:- start:151 stop:603 length:453 start_codon:yes stop_codon:yes gene_type:complete
MGKIMKWVGGIFVVLVIIGVATEESATPEQKAAQLATREAKQAAVISELPSYTAIELASAYEQNTVAANMKFKGKQFKVTGVVTDILTDFMDDPYITMATANEYGEPQFSFSDDALAELAAISKGMTLTLICTGNGDVIKTPMNKDCRMF